jgi:hypothetical protein
MSVGASGTFASTTVAVAAELKESPAPLLATTVKEYPLPFVRLEKVQLVRVPGEVHTSPKLLVTV